MRSQLEFYLAASRPHFGDRHSLVTGARNLDFIYLENVQVGIDDVQCNWLRLSRWIRNKRD